MIQKEMESEIDETSVARCIEQKGLRVIKKEIGKVRERKQV